MRASRRAPALAAIALLGAAGFLRAQEAGDRRAIVSGRVTEAGTGRPVDGVVIRVEGTELGALSDSLGRYRLVDVPPGPQTLRAERIGYATARVTVNVPLRGVLTRDIELAEKALEMEGLRVTVDAVSRARQELGTASVIDREAIQTQTATSLSGILELVPGIPLQTPGLGGVEQVALRSARTSGLSARTGGVSANTLASFGTPIILDGVPVSNNANLQSLGPRSDVSFTTTAGGGVDLRRIPANTLERVEVIRGVPSARWGDLTQGAIIVETRAGAVEPELGAQLDARTAEGTFAAGRSFGGPGHDGTVVFDVARSAISPGVSDDDALRLAGQLSHRAELGAAEGGPAGGLPEPRLTLDTRGDFFLLRENLLENPNTNVGRESRSREWGLRLIERARLRLGGASRLDFTGAFTTVNQDNELEAELIRGPMPITDRLTEGREEGFFVVGRYRGAADVEGAPHLLFGRLELQTRPGLPGPEHSLRLGLEPRREWNSGTGRQFDVARPLQNTFNGVRGFDRPRTFEDIPPLVTTAYYLDDRVTAVLGEDVLLQVQGGLRLDLLHEGGSWFTGVRDAVLQPRVNVELSPLPWLRLRAGAGRVAKAPTVAQLFPEPQYYDLVNVNQFTNDPAERYAVLTTTVVDPTNPELGFIRATKTEAGVEAGFGDWALSLVAFRDRIRDGIAIRPEPSFLLRERFALSDSVIGNGVKPEIIPPATGADTVPILIDRPANVVEQTNRGLELVASFPELEALKTRLHVTGALVETEQRRDGLDFGPRDRFTDFQLLPEDPRHPYWEPPVEYGKQALLQYRIVHHQPDVGLVLSATIQHNVTDEIQDRAATDTLAFAGYVTRSGELVPVPEAERGRPEYQDLRVPRSGRLFDRFSTPADWFMSAQVSKTLPLDGRLDFWAFNVLDRRGIFTDPEVLARIYPAVRFGLEVTMPLQGLLPGPG